MSSARLILESLRYHWRTNLAVALAVVATSAVLSGALLVGDSMRGSLKHLLLDQLGDIDEILVTDRFFRGQLAEDLSQQPGFREYFASAVPAIVVQGTVENPRASGALRAGRVTVIGSDRRFWTLGSGGPPALPGRNEIVLNAPLAEEIGAKPGDEVLLRIGGVSQIPPDSALGRKTETVRNRRLRVTAIVPAAGLARFALSPNQQLPRDAFVATETLQDALAQPGKVNAIFVAGRSAQALSPAADDALAASFRPTLADYGIAFTAFEPGYVQVTSDRMLLDPPAVTAVETTFKADRPQPLFTYLANTIAAGGREIPYSTITAIDFASQPPLGPFVSSEGKLIEPLADDEIALNAWAAEDLGVTPGGEVEITFFEPESTHGVVRESRARFRLKVIVPIAGLAADEDLTPQMPGVTDRLSIGDWDAPFPFEAGRVRKQDEAYWDEYHTTPKAFVSLATGRRLWSSRFGNTTAIRLAPRPGETATTMAGELKLDPAKFGFTFTPVKRLGLAAASGTTPFDALFMGFSMFIMVASLLLVALLFRLGIDERAAQIGLLRGLGIGNRRVRRLLVAEGMVVSIAGSVAGAVAGVGYAALMLAGLGGWWRSAISTPFLTLYVTPRSLLIGCVSGAIVSLATIVWSMRRLDKISVRRLMAGQATAERAIARGSFRKTKIAVGLLLLTAGALVPLGGRLGGEAAAGAFVGSGALVLTAGILAVRAWLAAGAGASLRPGDHFPIARLAARNGARNPSRSTLSIGLIAAASFLIVSLSAFRLDPTSQSRGRESGSGGFGLVAESDQPVYQDLNTRNGRADLGFSAAADDVLKDCDLYSLRVRAGDDASCLNLYQPTEPRLLGVGASLIERGGFAWADSAAESPAEKQNPWLLLEKPLANDPDGTPVVPVVLDFNTAEYSLHKGSIGQRIRLDDGAGEPLELQIVGLLRNSIFQGDVLLAEQALVRHFPQVNGYRFFLVDTHDEPLAKAEAALEGALGDFGFDAETSAQRLAAFFAVQNTYLSTFQSLGGLGLLLGTFGLAMVQLRSVLERRAELALMRAAGFRRALLARLVMIENSLLLAGGLALGIVAALVAVLPHWLAGGAAVPWLFLAATLGTVLVVGLLAGLLAVRATLRAELIPALRQE